MEQLWAMKAMEHAEIYFNVSTFTECIIQGRNFVIDGLIFETMNHLEFITVESISWITGIRKDLGLILQLDEMMVNT